MAVRSICLWPDPVLTQPCTQIAWDDPALPSLISDLFDTMYAANGRGLAAPQIGVLSAVFVVDVTWKEGVRDPRIFINPRALARTGEQATLDEQCLSIPDLPMPVMRPTQVQLSYDTPDGSAAFGRYEGVLARCIQHEFDHLQGKVIFDHQSKEDRVKLEAQYAA